MKFTKILASLLALVTVLSMFTGCNMTGNGTETTGENPLGDETPKIYAATAHLKVVDYDGDEIYSTDEDEPYEYTSRYYEPTVLVFVEDYAYMYSDEFSYKMNGSLIESISITKKKKTTVYSAGTEITSEYDGSKQKTFWVCMINGEEIDSMEDAVVKTGDVVVLRLAYKDSDKVTEAPPPEYVEPETPEQTT